MTTDDRLRIFALGGSAEYGERVCRHLGRTLDPLEERGFEDGEHKSRPMVDVRRREAVVIHSLYGDAGGDDGRSGDEKLVRLLFFVGALKESGAARVTVVAPYLCYARKDRQTKRRDPVITRYVAQLFEAVGTDHVVTIDVHNLAAYQNAFRCRTDHLAAEPLFVAHFAPLVKAGTVAVVSPDVGGTKRAEEFRRALATAIESEPVSGFMEKHRSGGAVSGETLVGDVRGRTVIIIDDLISSGTTMQRAAKACRDAGAAKIHAAATHGLFIGKAEETVADPLFDSIVVTDTVPPFRLERSPALQKVTVLDSSGLVADLIRAERHAG